MLLKEEDEFSNHSKSIARYFVGYGVLKDENVNVYDLSSEKWEFLVPKQMDKKKIKEMEKLNKSEADDKKSTIPI